MTPKDMTLPMPEIRPPGVEHDIPALRPAPYVSDAMVLYLNYIMRGSFDDVFPRERPIDATLEELQTIFAHYEVTFPSRCAIKPRLLEIRPGFIRSCLNAIFAC
jgi:hypothetical protein